MALARAFARVVAVEIDPAKAEMLRHNLRHVRRTDAAVSNVRVVRGDCLVELPKLLRSDAAKRVLVFADPPWGGRHYHASCADVHLKGERGGLEQLVRSCCAAKTVRHLLLKLPFNFAPAKLVAQLRGVVVHHVAHALSDKVQLLVLTLATDSGAPQHAAKKVSAKTKRDDRDQAPATADAEQQSAPKKRRRGAPKHRKRTGSTGVSSRDTQGAAADGAADGAAGEPTPSRPE